MTPLHFSIEVRFHKITTLPEPRRIIVSDGNGSIIGSFVVSELHEIIGRWEHLNSEFADDLRIEEKAMEGKADD